MTNDILYVALAQRIGGADGELVEALCEEIVRLREKVKHMQARMRQMDDDPHFFVTDIANRLPSELLREKITWSAMLSAVTQLKTERNNALAMVEELETRLSTKQTEDRQTIVDITMCTNTLCPLANKCYRQQAKPSEFQSTAEFDFVILADGAACGYYIPNRKLVAEDQSGLAKGVL